MATINSDFKKLVYTRIQAMPNGTEISIGSSGNITKSELLKHLKNEDEIGQKMYEIEKAFFDALKEGTLYDELT